MHKYNRNHKAITVLVTCLFFHVNVLANNNVVSYEEKLKISKKLFLGLNGSLLICKPSNSKIANDKHWKSLNGTCLNPSIDVYYDNGNIGIGTGLQFGKYTFGYSINNFTERIPNSFIDRDGEIYFPVYEDVNVKEITTINTFDIPIYFRYTNDFWKVSFFVHGGTMISFFRNMSYNLEGNLTRKGYYPNLNVTLGELGDIPEYNYYINKHFDGNERIKLNFPTFSISAFLSLGIQYEVYKDILCSFSFMGYYGVGDFGPDLPATYNEFYSIQYLEKITLSSLGFKFGVHYKLWSK